MNHFYLCFATSEFNFVCIYNQEHRSISRFISYALCATDEALRDANWIPVTQEEKEQTVIVTFFVTR